jgi:hypothetical protein
MESSFEEGGRRRKKEEEGGRRRKKEEEGGRRKKKEEGGRRRKRKRREGGRRKKEEEGGGRSTFPPVTSIVVYDDHIACLHCELIWVLGVVVPHGPCLLRGSGWGRRRHWGG